MEKDEMQRDTRSTVLLIEPDTSLRRLIALGLQHRGMQVIEISSLTALAEQPITDPDLLVLDIDNGYRDDASLLAAVQTHPYLSTLPMVVLAWERVQFAARPADLPLREYLGKPFDARLLHATIDPPGRCLYLYCFHRFTSRFISFANRRRAAAHRGRSDAATGNRWPWHSGDAGRSALVDAGQTPRSPGGTRRSWQTVFGIFTLKVLSCG
jgi:CheY-like chemotaxis protein